MYWHSFECSESTCTRGPTGLIIEVRIDGDKKPRNVKCPICKTSPRYRGFSAASEGGFAEHRKIKDEDFVRALREKSTSEIRQLLAEAKILAGWSPAPFGKTEYLHDLAQPPKLLALVMSEIADQWYATLKSPESKRLGPFATVDEAKHATETYLNIEHHYARGQ